MKRTLLRLFLTALATLGASAHGLPDDQDQPIKIAADRAEIDDANGTATYFGDVRLEQGTMRVTAATLTIETEQESVTRITAEGAPDGEPAHYQQQPTADEELVLADARTIVYHTTDARIELEGDASLRQAEDRFEGDRISYDVRARKVAATSEREDGRVNFTIRPERLSRERDGGEQDGREGDGAPPAKPGSN
ncbi:MAG TPA: lipopolysaccharide transport periplasmic protein LptA [Pseudomonadales bacterium]|nr:lipopolysaccharide transport periplasmic protein LptA [Pseudomonadales bacterium]